MSLTSSGRGHSRERVYPDSSLVDWGSGDAVGGRGLTDRTYGYDGYSDMALDEYRAPYHSDGGLLSVEELPRGRKLVWE